MENKIYIESSKGLKLAAVLHKPEGTGKFPGVVLLHGFTGYKDETHISALANKLSENGIAALRFDTSGFGESEGTIENDYRLSNFYTDTEKAFDYLKSLDFVDKQKLGVWGQSLGGTMAIIFAANNTWINSVCAVSAPTMFARKDNFERRTKAWEETGYFEKESSRYGLIKIPYDFVIDSKKWNSLDFIRKVKQPALFIVGTDDVNVFPDNTKEIYKLANEPKKFIEITGMSHGYKYDPQQVHEVNKYVVDFFRETLG